MIADEYMKDHSYIFELWGKNEDIIDHRSYTT